eukprot:COSAG06_NODE_38628_length_421_cov_1.096273_1_plen_117_part_10
MQGGGKGDFVPLWLAVYSGGGLKFSALDGSAETSWKPGALIRRAAAKGATIGKPKTARKGFEDALRLDLASGEEANGTGTELPGLKMIVAIASEDVKAGGGRSRSSGGREPRRAARA